MPARKNGDMYRKHADAGRLRARPGAAPEGQLPSPGLYRLGVRPDRDAALYVPEAGAPGSDRPLVVLLHGAGGTAGGSLDLLREQADEHGLLLLAMASHGRTWDVLTGGFGADVAAIDEALTHVFDRVPVQHGRIAIAGFSDGASYALSVGLTNGDLFSSIVAFSPGFCAPGPTEGNPRIFVSHGKGDEVLPINRCSRVLVPALRSGGYDVTYTEFDGRHTVPVAMREAAVRWLGGA
ncbi:MAG: phospholipase [Actinomycetota bacterium]|nr:phospholipase [Actinomycetota bacterium]